MTQFYNLILRFNFTTRSTNHDLQSTITNPRKQLLCLSTEPFSFIYKNRSKKVTTVPIHRAFFTSFLQISIQEGDYCAYSQSPFQLFSTNNNPKRPQLCLSTEPFVTNNLYYHVYYHKKNNCSLKTRRLERLDFFCQSLSYKQLDLGPH